MASPRLLVSSFALATVAALVGCGPDTQSGDDTGDDDPTTCEGDETRCTGNLYEVCVDGEFEIGEACQGACDPDQGCVDCNPAAGNACDGNTVVTCNADGTYGTVVEDCGADMVCISGECSRQCTADGVDLVYVVDQDYNLLSFDPRLLDTEGEGAFELIGQINCPAGAPLPGWTSPATPFSMSVDRDGVAWVLYTSGQIFHVDITDASCTSTSFQIQQAGTGGREWSLFGMGFVTDTPGGDTERLYIGGGTLMPDPDDNMFGYIDPGTLAITTVGDLRSDVENSPEFTGTGNAESFAYYPGTSSFVQQVDKSTGAGIGLEMPNGVVSGGPAAWAFAHWGGKFYVFVTDQLLNSTVRVTDRVSGTYEGAALEDLPYFIVGAGVSTCAPVVVE